MGLAALQDGISVTQPGIEPISLHLQGGFFNTGPPERTSRGLYVDIKFSNTVYVIRSGDEDIEIFSDILLRPR